MHLLLNVIKIYVFRFIKLHLTSNYLHSYTSNHNLKPHYVFKEFVSEIKCSKIWIIAQILDGVKSMIAVILFFAHACNLSNQPYGF